MSLRVVAMTALPAPVTTGRQRREDLSHLAYARATWEWWCAKHGVDFVIVDRSPATEILPTAPATILRWSALAEIIRTRPKGTCVALVDADTMVRWDTPDFFACYDGRLGAVRGQNRTWIRDTIRAFQPLFPHVALRSDRYFNAGVVLAGESQLELLMKFGKFCAERFAELDGIFRGSLVGTDQTPLNLMVRQERHRVSWLPVVLNLTHCFDWPDLATRMEFEDDPDADWAAFETRVLRSAPPFAFIDWGYIWHFNNTLAARSRIMAETWKRVRHRYG